MGNRPKNHILPDTMSVAEVMQLQSADSKESLRTRGAPMVKAYGGPALLGRPIEEITHDDFREILARYRQGRKDEDTGLRLIYQFNRLIHWAVKKEIRKRPFISFKVPPGKPLTDRLLSTTEMARVIRVIDELHAEDLPIRLALRALASLGLGLQQAMRFSLARVDFECWEYIQDDKKGRLRLIPIPKDMRALVAKARQFSTPEGKSKLDGTLIAQNWKINEAVKIIGERCNRPDLTAQILTRSFLYS